MQIAEKFNRILNRNTCLQFERKQIVPLPIFRNNSLYILDEIEELIVKTGNKFVMTEKCITIKKQIFLSDE